MFISLLFCRNSFYTCLIFCFFFFCEFLYKSHTSIYLYILNCTYGINNFKYVVVTLSRSHLLSSLCLHGVNHIHRLTNRRDLLVTQYNFVALERSIGCGYNQHLDGLCPYYKHAVCARVPI